MLLQILLASLAGGVVCLDRAIVQAMVSRPIVAAPLVGLVLGDLQTGLISGAFIELLWIDRLPVGSYLPPNDSVAAILAASASVIVGHQSGQASRELIVCSILFFLPFGYLGRQMDSYIVSSNDGLALKGLEDAKKADTVSLSRRHLMGVVKLFSLTTALLFASLLVGVYALSFIFPHLPVPVMKALNITYLFFPLLGAATAINTINLRGTIPLFSASFLIVMVILEFAHVG